MKNRRDFLKDVLKIGGVAAAISCGFSVDEIFAGQGMGPGPDCGHNRVSECVSALSYSNTAYGYGGSGGVTSIATATSSWNVSSGNLLVAYVAYSGSSYSVTGISDTVNTYTLIARHVNGTQVIEAWYVVNASAKSNAIATASLDGSVTYATINVFQYTGPAVSSYVTYSVGDGNGTAVTTASVTTDCIGSLILSGYRPSGGSSSWTIESSPLSFTDRSSGSWIKVEEYVGNSLAIGTYTPTGTISYSVDWTGITVVFK